MGRFAQLMLLISLFQPADVAAPEDPVEGQRQSAPAPGLSPTGSWSIQTAGDPPSDTHPRPCRINGTAEQQGG